MSEFSRARSALGSRVRPVAVATLEVGLLCAGLLGCSGKDRERVPATSEPTFDLDGQTWQIKAVAKDESDTCARSFTAVFQVSQDGGDITYIRLLDDGEPSADSLIGTAFSETNKFPDLDRFDGAPIYPGFDRIVDLEGSIEVEVVDAEGISETLRLAITDSALVVDEALGVMDGNLELSLEGCGGQWSVFSKRLPEEEGG